MQWRLFSLIACVPWAVCAQPDAARRLQEGIDLAESRGDCRSAIPVFEDVAKQRNRDLAARGLLYAGRCYELLGSVKAAAVYRQVAAKFRDRGEYASEAESRLSALGASPLSGRTGAATLASRVLKLIPVGKVPYRAVMAASGGEVYVSNAGDDSITVIDTTTDLAVANLPVRHPGAVTASADGRTVYAGSYPEHSLSIIDTRTKAVRTVDPGGPVRDIAPTTDGSSVYISLGHSGLRKLDVASGTISEVATPPCPTHLAIPPMGQVLWIGYQCGGPGGRPGHDVIGKFDTASGALVNTITGLANVAGVMSISPDGSTMWAQGQDACTHPKYDHIGCPPGAKAVIHAIDLRNETVIRTLGFGGSVGYTTFLPRTRLAAVGTGDQLLFFDSRTLKPAGSMPIPTIGGLAYTSDGLRAYAPLREQGAVAVLEMFLTAVVRVASHESIVQRAGSLIRLVLDSTINVRDVDPASIRFAGAPAVPPSFGKPLVSIGNFVTVGEPDLAFYVRADALSIRPGTREVLFQAQTRGGFPIRALVPVNMAP